MLKETSPIRSVNRVSPTYRVGTPRAQCTPIALDFFAGSGLVTTALKPFFSIGWANDICVKKASVYQSNHPDDHFVLGPIEKVQGQDLPPATLSWASFPCQDLSLAGNLEGIGSGRSGLVWHWLRIMDEMTATVREFALLMGAGKSYNLPGSYNDGYKACLKV